MNFVWFLIVWFCIFMGSDVIDETGAFVFLITEPKYSWVNCIQVWGAVDFQCFHFIQDDWEIFFCKVTVQIGSNLWFEGKPRCIISKADQKVRPK